MRYIRTLMFAVIATFTVLSETVSVHANTCDVTFPTVVLRHGRSYTFYDDYHNRNNYTHGLTSFSFRFTEQYDYNQAPEGSNFFNWTSTLRNAGFKVPGNATMRIIESTTSYPILRVPARRSPDNLRIQYTVRYK